jgi:hypothetical protein
MLDYLMSLGMTEAEAQACINGTMPPQKIAKAIKRGAGNVHSKVAELRGVRLWDFALTVDGPRLRSVSYRNVVWDGPILRADVKPTLKNSHGIYVVKHNMLGVAWNSYRTSADAAGEVDMLGTVVEHEHGYRAEMVRIRELRIDCGWWSGSPEGKKLYDMFDESNCRPTGWWTSSRNPPSVQAAKYLLDELSHIYDCPVTFTRLQESKSWTSDAHSELSKLSPSTSALPNAMHNPSPRLLRIFRDLGLL